MKCQICKERPSTGIIFEMCDECFEEFEQRVEQNSNEGYTLTEQELSAVSEPFIDRSKN